MLLKNQKNSTKKIDSEENLKNQILDIKKIIKNKQIKLKFQLN